MKKIDNVCIKPHEYIVEEKLTKLRKIRKATNKVILIGSLSLAINSAASEHR